MFVVGIIFRYLSMLVIGQSQFIILSSVNDSLLNRCVYFSKSHWCSSRIKCLHHCNTGRTLLHTDFFAFQILWCFNRTLTVKISGPCIVPGYHTETSLICRFINSFHVVCILHNRLVHLFGIKQIRHTENLINIRKGFQIGRACHYKINGSCLCQLNGFLCRT